MKGSGCRIWSGIEVINMNLNMGKTMKVRKACLCLAGCLFSLAIRAERVPMKLWYDEPATEWMTSALPVGNGEIGAMFFGGVGREQVQFNDKTLWAGSPTQRGAYQNMGDLFFDFGTPEGYAGYRRELSLDDAVGRVSYVLGGVEHVREYFASRPDSVIVVRLALPSAKGALNFTLRLEGAHQEATKVVGHTMTIGGTLDLLSYEAQVVLLTEGGTVEAFPDGLKVSGADAATVLLTGATNFDLASPTYTRGGAEEVHGRVSARMAKAAGKSYEELKESHLADYRPLFSRVDVNFGQGMPDYPTDVLVREHADHPYLDMLYFQYGRYLMLGSSRGGQLPSNLQGLWNNVNHPAWECDYHSNINVQMNYWPAEVANLSECYAPFIEYVSTEALKPGGSWQRVARKEHCRGWAVHTQNNIFGYTDWNINRPANAWYCTHLWQHYAYTLDRGYLRDTAFPVMKSTCEYWFDRLEENADGRLVAPDEWSPEHGPWEDGVAYAQQLIYALFEETLSAACALRVHDGFVQELEKKFARLDNGLHVGSWGQIKEWTREEDVQGDNHRHLSHLMALFPCDEISCLKDLRYVEAAKVSLNSRGDGATGWSRAWKVACWARLWDGERAYRLLKQAQHLTDVTVVSMDDHAGGVYENLFCAHPSFQIDGNFGATAGIAEMLLQNTPKGIYLLPALPKAWADGHFRGLKAHGCFVVDAVWAGGRLTEVEVTSGAGMECKMYFPGRSIVRVENTRGRKVGFVQSEDGMVAFRTKPGVRYRLFFETPLNG